MKIRTEEPKDYKEVQNLIREAFWNLYEPGASQHYLIHLLRKQSDFIPELSLVIQQNDKILAHIAYSKSKVVVGQNQYETITFGPVSVIPQKQSQSLGSTLIKFSIEKAKELGYKAIIIQGYVNYYKRFGFIGAKKYGITDQDNNFPKGTQIIELQEGYLSDKKGIFKSSQLFNINREEAEQFDKLFVKKEKYITKSQLVFAAIIAQGQDDPDPPNIKDAANRQKIDD